MTARRNYTLSADELAEVVHAINYHEEPEVRPRAMALHLLHQGMSATRVAELSGVSRGLIYVWHDRWRRDGIPGLVDKDGRGRHHKATAIYITLLHEALEGTPGDYDYSFAVWTVSRLGEHLFQQTGLRLSDRTLSDLLGRLGYVYRRPKYTLKHLQDPAAVAVAEATLAVLRGGPSSQATAASQPTSSSLWTKAPAPSSPPSSDAG
jgi:transposase